VSHSFAALGVPVSKPPSCFGPGGECLLSDLGNLVSDWVEAAVFQDEGILKIEGNSSVL
jgi:hypothetical protein